MPQMDLKVFLEEGFFFQIDDILWKAGEDALQ